LWEGDVIAGRQSAHPDPTPRQQHSVRAEQRPGDLVPLEAIVELAVVVGDRHALLARDGSNMAQENVISSRRQIDLVPSVGPRHGTEVVEPVLTKTWLEGDRGVLERGSISIGDHARHGDPFLRRLGQRRTRERQTYEDYESDRIS
jgi:hypothetical protein